MSDDAGRPGLKQLLWIAAGVAVLTLLVVVASWLFSPRPSTSDASMPRGSATLKEEQVQKDTFSPESPGGRPAAPAPQAALPESQAQRAPAPAPESPAPQPQAPPVQPPAEAKAPKDESPAPREAPAAPPKAEPAPPAPPVQPATHGGYGVQVGAFAESSKAKEVAARLESLHYKTAIISKDGKFKVVAKGFPDRAAAEKAQEALAKAGIKDPFIVPVE